MRRAPLLLILASLFGLLVFGAISLGALYIAASPLWASGDDNILRLELGTPFLLIGVVGFVLCLRPFFRQR